MVLLVRKKFNFSVFGDFEFQVMAFMATPLLHKSAQGDLAGVGANLMLKTSIGNIGECGRFGELCADVTYVSDLMGKIAEEICGKFQVPYRKLNPGSEVLLRDRTPLYGGLDACNGGILWRAGSLCNFFSGNWIIAYLCGSV